MKFQENPDSGSCSVHIEGQTGRPTDRQDVGAVAFSNFFANTLREGENIK